MKTELEAAAIYKILSTNDNNLERAGIFEDLYRSEMRHAAKWAALIDVDARNLKPNFITAKAIYIRLFSRIFGVTKIIPWLSKIEAKEIKLYANDEYGRDIIEGVLDSEKIKRITRGINIGRGEIGKAKVVRQKMIKGRCHVRLVLRQGKKREIRRIFRTLKIKLYKLHRVSFGGVGLNGLKESEFRLLDENEIKQLKIEISSN